MSPPPLPIYATHIINPFLTSRIKLKGLGIGQSGNPYTYECSSSIESLLLSPEPVFTTGENNIMHQKSEIICPFFNYCDSRY